jgi:hypothetical protein
MRTSLNELARLIYDALDASYSYREDDDENPIYEAGGIFTAFDHNEGDGKYRRFTTIDGSFDLLRAAEIVSKGLSLEIDP